MNIYWFSDKDGHFWLVIVARNEQEAWEIFSKTDADQRTVEELKEEYELDQTTVVGEKSGIIATIFPLEVDFYLKEEPKID